jgi:hypothetical protein
VGAETCLARSPGLGGRTLALQPPLLDIPPVAFMPVELETANALLRAWGHYLGPIRRFCASQAWALELDGVPVSLAVSSSIVSPAVAGYRRTEVVELARLCSRPDAPWATRVALRLWREVAAPRWPHWRVRAAVSYSQNGRGDGGIYRHDGWERADTRAGTCTHDWGRRRPPDDPRRGAKTLWLYRYPPAPPAGC